MQSKILSRQTLLIIVLAGFALSPALLFHFIANSSIRSNSIPFIENTSAIIQQAQASSGLPAHLKIPKINVNVPLESVGLTSDGAMGVPKNHANAAWFNQGPRPGDKGSSVIDGHFGWWKNGTPAVFNNLYKLQKGDKIYVEDEKGATTAFVVRESRSYDPNAKISDVFTSSDGESHLNLITCEGVWNNIQQSYSKRLVVFTDKKIE